MAEALAIIGLVSNVLSFIDFGTKFVSGTRNVRDSLYGTTAEVRELELIVEHVEKYHEQVERQQASGQRLSVHEQRILDMVRQCRAISGELHKAIKRLHVREGRSKTIEKEVKKAQGALAMNYDAKLDQIRDEILALVGQNHRSEQAIQMAQLASLITKFDALGKEHTACTKQNALLKSLYFRELHKRWTKIRKADRASNTWIFDTSLTPFTVWLASTEEDDGLFCITGRLLQAGSGKSTLMKFVTEDSRTYEHLRKWAGTTKLCTASYFFWNQGHEMQMSQRGLFQSLLYQILKSLPRLIESVCPSHLEHEEWEVEELKAIFARIATQEDLEVKFCFFIDGLDEYDGAEEDVVNVLEFLSDSKDIKICASTRPRKVFKEFFHKQSRTFDIKDFTKEDIGRHVQRELAENEKFRRLENSNFACETLTKAISDRAQGVWLWVYLVTRDLVRAVNRNEGVDMLWKIMTQFPADLEKYFSHILKAVESQYLEEMSQIFLITVDELQPLPLYAFSLLLESECKNPAYAINLPIRPLRDSDLKSEYPTWKERIENRCSDLLIVDDEDHQVDFLHRTVRDFLRDNYYPQLQANLKDKFSSTSTLCRMCLVMLKSLPDIDFKSPSSINKVIGLTDELLYYAYETEQADQSPMSTLVEVLDEADRVNIHHARGVRNHWTHARDAVGTRGLDVYEEGDTYNFLALTVQARLVKYVRAKLNANKEFARKGGRPLLDYALRPRRITPIRMPYHSKRDDPSVNVDIKCDETKPVCSRCRSTGRTCEGYGLWGGGGNTYVERYGLVSTSIQKPPTKVLGVEELRYLQLYRIRIVHTTSGWFASKFWNSIVLPAASSEPAVLHAAVALSAAHRCSFDSAQAPDEREKFMLQQYGKAIQSLQPLLRRGDKASVTVILVTCQLFTLLEYLRGQYQLAESHLRNGLKVLMNMTTKRDRSHDGVLVIKPASYEKSIDQGIVRSFATLHMQSNLFGSGLEDLDIFLQPTENNIPYPTFTTIEEAKDALDVLLHGIVLIAQQYRKMGPGTKDEIAAVTAGQEDITTSLAMWYDTYLSTLPSVEKLALAAGRKPDELWAFGGKTPPAKLPTDREPSVLKLLLMYHAMAGIMCGCLQVHSEQHYEAYTQTFLTILVHAIYIFEEYSLAKSIPDNVNLHDSIGEYGFIAPLYYTAIKCRYHRIRLHAIRLLRVIPLKEGTWDSFTAANIAETVMELEEQDTRYGDNAGDGFSLSEIPNLEDSYSWSLMPEHNMFHDVEATTRGDLTNEVVVTCKRRRLDGSPEVITFHANPKSRHKTDKKTHSYT
ncbi:hypothetical protein J4E80_004322 [Alternaria sp. BMP 0032]|nr:hypothetical protein J4E80_004322 [Alternaria sp. BMP 0032]